MEAVGASAESLLRSSTRPFDLAPAYCENFIALYLSTQLTALLIYHLFLLLCLIKKTFHLHLILLFELTLMVDGVEVVTRKNLRSVFQVLYPA